VAASGRHHQVSRLRPSVRPVPPLSVLNNGRSAGLFGSKSARVNLSSAIKVQIRSFSNALKWAYAGNIGDRSISALVTLVLASILGPRDFGLVSIALIYISFLQMFLDQGLASALIQKKDLRQEHCDAVFWLNLAMSVSFVVLTISISGWWGRINHAPDVSRVLSVLSLCIPIEGLSIVQSAIVRRGLDFRTLTIRSNVSAFLGGVTGVALALVGSGVWALVGMQLVRDCSALVLLWKLGHWRPKFEFSYRHLRELLGFSFHTFLGGLGTFADVQMGSLLLGILFGPVAVGLYRLAERLMNSVVAMATTSIQGVSLPEFSRLQDLPGELRKSALSCIRLSSMVTMPALMGMAVVSGPLMAVLGPKWIPATNVLKILCAQGMIFTLSYFTGPLLTALGRPDVSAKLEWLRALIGVVSIVVIGLFLRKAPVSWQLDGMAFARAMPNVLFITPLFLYLLMRFAHLSLRDVLSALSNPVFTSLSIITAIYLLQIAGVSTLTQPRALVATEIVIGAAAGIGTLLSLDRQLRGVALGFVRRVGWPSAVNK
jgi:teichuronic acid exporter